MEHEQITLTLQPLRSHIPATVRIRAALKTLLRGYRLRCVRIGGAPARQTAQDHAGRDISTADEV